MAWNNINIPLKDGGINAARKYLAEQKGINNSNCIFHNGNFQEIRKNGGAFQLYIVAHGCSDAPSMASGKHANGVIENKELYRNAKELAFDLINKGLPTNREARIKLCLCFAAKQFGDAGMFAQDLARALYHFGKLSFKKIPAKNSYETPNFNIKIPFFENISAFQDTYVGGFTMEVLWGGNAHHYPPQIDNTRATRLYYRCDEKGTLVTDGTDRVHDPDYLGGHFLHKLPSNKWGNNHKPAHKANKYCYFPFDYLPN